MGENVGALSLKWVPSTRCVSRASRESVQTSDPVSGESSVKARNRPSGEIEAGTRDRVLLQKRLGARRCRPARTRLRSSLPRVPEKTIHSPSGDQTGLVAPGARRARIPRSISYVQTSSSAVPIHRARGAGHRATCAP